MNDLQISIENLQLSYLKETKGNPQIMDEKTFSGIVKSMKEKGWLLDAPVIWEKGESDFQIISGHHRVMAGIEAGIVETQCKVIKGITEEQAKILVLEANQRRGSFSSELLTGYLNDFIDNYDYEINDIIDEVGFLGDSLDMVEDSIVYKEMQGFEREDYNEPNERVQTKDSNWIYIEFYGDDELYKEVMEELGKDSFVKNSRELKREKFLELLGRRDS